MEGKTVTVEELLKENEALKTENEALKKGQETAVKVIGELKAKLESAENEPKAQFPTVKVGKDTYEIVIPQMRIGGDVLTAQELAKKPELVKKLVDSESEALRKKS